MLTKFLSEDERNLGQKRALSFQTLNGLGYNFMGETPVYLLAIHFGASNLQLGYISSVMFLTGFILVAIPKLLAGKNLVKVQSAAWFLRGLLVILFFSVLFVDDKTAVLLILIIYTLFCAVRMVGVAVWNSVIKMLTTPQGRGSFISQGNIANQTASVVSKLTSFIFTSFQYFSGVIGILILQMAGVVFNIAAAARMRQVPCRETVEYKPGRNIFVILGESLKSSERRYPLVLKWITVSILVLNSLTIAFVRKEAGFSANLVFLYSMVLALAIIMSGMFTRIFADRIGSRPILIGMNILLSGIFIVWMLLPVSPEGAPPVFIYFILGFFTNFFLWSDNVLVSRVFVNTMPESESFSYNAMTNFVSAFFSFAGGMIGGALIDLGQTEQTLLFNVYSFMFLFASMLSIGLLLMSLRLIDRGSLSAKETAAILFSFEGLRAYIDIGKLNATEDPVKKKTVLLSISRNEAPVATEELKSILASPLSSEKGEVLKALFSNPRPVLLPEILKEASDYGSYHQLKAIFALGAYPGKETEKLLVRLLDHPDISVRSNAAKSLGRIGSVKLLEKVKRQSLESKTPWDRINYMIALKNMDPDGTVFSTLFQEAGRIEGRMFRQTYYSLAADILDFKPSLAEIYSTKNLRKGEGVREFLEGTRDLDFFYRSHRDLKNWFRSGEWANIWKFCRNTLETVEGSKDDFSAPLENLKQGILEASGSLPVDSDKKNITMYDDALAAVYFTYQISTG